MRGSGAGSNLFSSALTPWHIPGRWGGPHVREDNPEPSLARRHHRPSSSLHLHMEIRHMREDTGESPSQAHGTVCWEARFLYFITRMWQEDCSLMSFKYAPLISCSEPHSASLGWFSYLANRESWDTRQVLSPVLPLALDTCWAFWDK